MNSTAKDKMKNVFTNNSNSSIGGVKKERRIISTEKISKSDEDGIVRLYETLVSRENIKRIDIPKVKKTFPSFEDIDIKMIVEEAFPAFEATIGVENFAKVKKYFGIGVKQSKTQKNRDVELLIANLRTIENAQYYICGYKELISKVAKKLENSPKDLTELEKAKIARMYFVIYLGYYYFVEDYSPIPGTVNDVQVNYSKALENNKFGFYPEELFSLYISKMESFGDESVFYDIIYLDIKELEENNRRLLKDVMKFAELTFSGGRFSSVNKVLPNQTFADVRKIKDNLHKEPGVFPLEIFVEKELIDKLNLPDFYSIFKLLKTQDFENVPKKELQMTVIEGSRIVTKNHLCYQIDPDMYVAGPIERARFIRMMEYMAYREFTMATNTKENGEPRKKVRKYNIKQFINAIQFANDANYLTSETTVKRDIKVANQLIKMDKKKALMEYSIEKENAVEEMKKELGIDEQFEYDFLGIKKPIALEEVVKEFALKNFYVELPEQLDISLVQNVLIPENETFWEKYSEGEITETTLKKKIGFSEEFAKMFFSLEKIDVSEIEAKLLEEKKTTIGSKKISNSLKLVVTLYCYIVENQIPCGPKKRVPKRNKTLKPSNLKKLI